MQNKPLDENQLQALLRLKRYEQPPAGYFENLLDRIHRRQREELLRRPAWQIALERVRAFFAPLQMDWRHAGSMAAILVGGILAIRVAIPERVANPTQVAIVDEGGNSPVPKPYIAYGPIGPKDDTVQPNRPVQRDPSVPVRFIIDTQPVSFSYETTHRF